LFGFVLPIGILQLSFFYFTTSSLVDDRSQTLPKLRCDRWYGVALARFEDGLKQLDLCRQALGSRVSDAIIDGEFSETTQAPASIPGPDAGGQ